MLSVTVLGLLIHGESITEEQRIRVLAYHDRTFLKMIPNNQTKIVCLGVETHSLLCY